MFFTSYVKFKQQDFILLLEYKCVTNLCQILLYNKVNQLYWYIYPLPLEPPFHTPSTCPSWSSQSAQLSSLCHIAASHWLFYIWQCIYVSPTLPIHLTLPFLPYIHTSTLYICNSFPALQTSASAPFFQIPYICINIQYLNSRIVNLEGKKINKTKNKH